MHPWNNAAIPNTGAGPLLSAVHRKGGAAWWPRREARKFGVRSAMPSKKVLELCPEVLFVRPCFDAYQEASRKIRHDQQKSGN